MRIQRLGPVQIDFEHIEALPGGDDNHRSLSPKSLSIALSAVAALKYNRYWKYGERYLTIAEQQRKNDAVDRAIFELLEAVEIAELSLTGGGSGGGLCEYEGDDFMGINLITIGGVTYIVKPSTCCGDDQLFPLHGPANVTIGQGGAVVASGQDSDAGYTMAPVPDDALSCYAGKVVPYMLGRAYEYFETSNGILQYGLDVVVGGVDEVIDLGSLIKDLLGGDTNGAVDTLRNFDEADVATAYSDPEFVAIMVSLWEELGYSGAVSKSDLRAWAGAAPKTWNGVPVRLLLEDWSSRSLVLGYSNDLKEFAAECEYATTLDELNADQAEWLGYQDVEVNGTVYRVWTFEPEATIVPGGEWLVPAGATDGYTNKAIAAEWTLTQSGNMMLYLDPVSKYRLFESIPSGVMTYRATHVSSDAMAAITQVSGQSFTTVSAQDGSTNGKVGAVAHSIAQNATLHRLWLAGVAS